MTILITNIDITKGWWLMRFFSRRKQSKVSNKSLLLDEINKTKMEMEAAYSHFENVVDPDLIDSCIYELNAVQTRYKFLLKQAKASVGNSAESS